jgi:O-antigen ligase
MASVADSLGLGTGPGTSSLAAAELGFSLPIENSLLQILVSLGVPGLLLFGLLIGLALRASLRNPGGLAAASALVAYVVSVSGYNAIDDRRSAHVILGLLLVIALNARSSAGSERVADLSSRRAT